MAITKINPFAPVALEQKLFLWWEDVLTDKALALKTATLRLFNISWAVNTMEVEVEQMAELPTGWLIGDWSAGWWDATAIVDLPISTDLAGKITNYTVLLVEDELVVVKSVDRTAETIDVYQRGHGWTTGATHADEIEAEITGYNYVVGVKDIESRVLSESTHSYYVAKNTIPAVSFTKEDLILDRKYYGEAGQADYVSSQIDKNEKDLMINMSKSLINHWGQVATNTNPWMVVGIIAEAMTRGNIKTSFGTISTVVGINDALTASRNKGGSADIILCGSRAYDAIQKLANDSGITQSVPSRLELVLGSSVAAIVTKVGTLVPVMDLNFPDDKMIICNSSDLHWSPLLGFETPWADRTTSQESTRNNQAFTVDSLTQWAAWYENTNINTTIITGITY